MRFHKFGPIRVQTTHLPQKKTFWGNWQMLLLSVLSHHTTFQKILRVDHEIQGYTILSLFGSKLPIYLRKGFLVNLSKSALMYLLHPICVNIFHKNSYTWSWNIKLYSIFGPFWSKLPDCHITDFLGKLGCVTFGYLLFHTMLQHYAKSNRVDYEI